MDLNQQQQNPRRDDGTFAALEELDAYILNTCVTSPVERQALENMQVPWPQAPVNINAAMLQRAVDAINSGNMDHLLASTTLRASQGTEQAHTHLSTHSGDSFSILLGLGTEAAAVTWLPALPHDGDGTTNNTSNMQPPDSPAVVTDDGAGITAAGLELPMDARTYSGVLSGNSLPGVHGQGGSTAAGMDAVLAVQQWPSSDSRPPGPKVRRATEGDALHAA